MVSPLQSFIRELSGVAVAALLSVLAIAFLSMPYTLGGHPGELRSADATVLRHMT
jgi:hypothetical protein